MFPHEPSQQFSIFLKTERKEGFKAVHIQSWLLTLLRYSSLPALETGGSNAPPLDLLTNFPLMCPLGQGF